VISGSIAITADAFNNLSDAGSSLITLLGFRLAGMKPDADHPFGHGRIEYLSGLTVSVLILIMGFELGKSSVMKIIRPSPVEYGCLPLAILAVSVCVKIYMFLYNRSLGKKIQSAGMRATSLDSLSDAVSTAVVLLCSLIARRTGLALDGWCGILVALFIFWTGFSSAGETVSPLLGRAPSSEFVADIERLVLSHSEILGIHDLLVHDYGPGRVIISLHAEVDGHADIFASHDAIDLIERELKSQFGCLATIHMDPIDCADPELAPLKGEVSDIAESVFPGIGIHDFRIVPGSTHTNLIFDVEIPGDCPIPDEEIVSAINKGVCSRHENHFCIINIDKYYTR